MVAQTHKKYILISMYDTNKKNVEEVCQLLLDNINEHMTSDELFDDIDYFEVEKTYCGSTSVPESKADQLRAG